MRILEYIGAAAGGAIVAMVMFVTLALPAHATTATPSSASVAASSHTRLWWDGTTCRAFTAFGSRPTAERFRHLVQDSRHADTYLKADVGAWANDRAQHLSHAVLADDLLFVADDCGGSYGL